jgi:hypothetical protein
VAGSSSVGGCCRRGFVLALALFSPAPYLEVLRHLTEGLRDLGRWGSSRMPLVAEIGDITRFATARKLCAWAELIPQVRDSDRTVRHGYITKQGLAVRWVLTEAAQRAKTQPPFTRFYAQCPPPRHPDRHRRGRAQAARPLFPHPQPGPGHDHHQPRRSAPPGALASQHAPATRPSP